PLRIHTTGTADGYLDDSKEGFVRVEATAAGQSIHLTEAAEGGDLMVDQILTDRDTGHVELIVENGHLVGRIEGTAPNVQAETIELVALKGGIGRDTVLTDTDTAHALRVDTAETGRVDLYAQDDVWLTETEGNLRVGQMISAAGDLHLTGPEAIWDSTDGNGEAWTLPETVTGIDDEYLPEHRNMDGEQVNLKAVNLYLHAERGIGAQAERLNLVESGFVYGETTSGEIWLNEAWGDLVIQQLSTHDDLHLSAPYGSLYGVNNWRTEEGDRADGTIVLIQTTGLKDSDVTLIGHAMHLDAAHNVGDRMSVLSIANCHNGALVVNAGQRVWLAQPRGDMIVHTIKAEYEIVLQALSGSILGWDKYWSEDDVNLDASDITLIAGKNIGGVNYPGEGYDEVLSVKMRRFGETGGLRAIAGGGISIFSAGDLPVDVIRSDSWFMRMFAWQLLRGIYEKTETSIEHDNMTELEDAFDRGDTDACVVQVLGYTYKMIRWDTWDIGKTSDGSTRLYATGSIIDQRVIRGNSGESLQHMITTGSVGKLDGYANLYAPYAYLESAGAIGTGRVPFMTAVEKALSFSVDGSAFIKQRYLDLNIDQIWGLNHVTLDSDFAITMNGTKVPDLMVGSLRPALNGAYAGLSLTLISRLGDVGGAGAPFLAVTPETILDVYGSAWLRLLTGGVLSGTVGGSADVTGGGSLKLNGLTVKGHGSLNSGSISGSYSGSDLALNVNGSANLNLWLTGGLSGLVTGNATLTGGSGLTL
ncbi:MAG: hypothetical protein IJ343_14805, partial [Clostridia bacterium]|nr:hypothetical protein [Clostridia bacterium]